MSSKIRTQSPRARTCRSLAAHACAASTLVALAGCSALVVDVDVYKGPLSNEPQVQAQEITALATAAKPLLVELRDRMEWGSDPRQLCAARDKAINDGWYKTSFVPPSHTAGDQFKDFRAVQVNSVLSLYEDRTLENLNLYVVAMREHASVYSRAYVELSGGLPGDRSVWERLKKELPGERQVARFTGTTEKAAESAFEMWLALSDAARQFAVPNPGEFREAKGLQEAAENFEKVLKDSKLLASTSTKLQSSTTSGNSRAMELLAAGDLATADRITRLLLAIEGSPESPLSDAGKAYRSMLHQKAKAFLTARDAVRNLWRTAITLAQVANDWAASNPEALGIADVRMTRRAVASLNTASIELLSTLVRPDALQIALVQGPQNRSAAVSELRQGLIDAGWVPDQEGSWEKIAAALPKVLTKSPEQGIAALNELDEFYQQFNASDSQPSPRWGLVRGPTTNEISSEQITALLDVVSASAAAGLERGRPAVGLDTLSESFLRFHHEDPARTLDHPDTERYYDSLVQFAEKILFLANNQPLISQRHSEAKQATTFSALLQELGNSIIVQVNELRARSAHARHDERMVEPRRDAVTQLAQRSPEQMFDAVVDSVTAARENALTPVREGLQSLGIKVNDECSSQEISAAVAPAAAFNGTKPSLAEADRAAAALSAARDPSVAVAIRDAGNNSTGATNAAKFDDVMKVVVDLAQKTMLADLNTLNDAPEKPARSRAHTELSALRHYFETAKETPGTFAFRVISLNAGDWSERVAAVASDTVNTAAESLRAAIAEFTAKSAAKETADRVTTASSEAKRLCDALSELQQPARRSSVVASLSGRRDLSGDAVIALLASAFDADSAASGKSPEQITALRNAAAVIRATPVPVGRSNALASATGQWARTGSDIWSGLIIALEGEYIAAVRQSGENSVWARNLLAALEAARLQRASTIYVRPPATYLKSANAATALQSSPQAEWTNLLGEQALKSIPGMYEAVTNSGGRDARTRQFIDSQNWENINRVRVSGAGNTNFVLAKDDVGNWYVKEMETNVDSLVQSMYAAAMFAYGVPGGIDFSGSLPLSGPTPPARGPGQPANPTPSPSPVESQQATPVAQRLLDGYRARFQERTTSDAESLSRSIDSAALARRITTALSEHPETSPFDEKSFAPLLGTEFTTPLADSIKRLNQAASAKGTDSAIAAGRTIAEELSTIRRLAESTAQRARSATITNDAAESSAPTDDQRTKARERAAEIIRSAIISGIIKPMADKREAAVREYRDGLSAIVAALKDTPS